MKMLSYCCRVVVLATLCALRAGGFSTHPPCSWLHPSNCEATSEPLKPVLGLTFLHNRKSGGTHILHFLSEWLRQQGCLDREEDLQGYENIERGHILRGPDERHFKASQPVPCPSIDYLHDEFRCFAGDLVAEARDTQHAHKYKILTTFRDPIERIGSQFFHTEECYGRRHIIETVAQQCHTSYHAAACRNELRKKGRQHKSCPCIYTATAAAIENLKKNESVWFDWFLNSKRGLRDQYMPNYFVRRLASVDNSGAHERKSNHTLFQTCVRSPNDCKIDNTYSLLRYGSGFIGCLAKETKHRDDVAALAIAKKLLPKSVHFLIMEHFGNVNSVKRALSDVIPGAVVETLISSGGWSRDTKTSRSGHLHAVDPTALENIQKLKVHQNLEIGMYQKLMPLKVVEYLKQANKEDYELYRLACRIYEDRFLKDS